MVRTIAYFLVGITVVGTIATPGLGAVALVATPLLGLGFLWRIALAVSTRGRTSEAILRTRKSHLLGPGGPDDPFAGSSNDEVEHLAEPSVRAVVSAENGPVRGANDLRPGLSDTLSVRSLGENSIEGVGG